MIGIKLIIAMVIILALPLSVKAVSFGANESSLIAQGTVVDLDFFMLTEFYGMNVNETLNYNFTYQSTGWSGNLSGTYNGTPVNVEYSGNTSSFPSGAITWNSSGTYGSDAWIGNGSALITGTGGTFQVDFNSSLNIGNNTGASKYLINGTENASEIKYDNSSGTIWINGLPRIKISPSLRINLPKFEIINDINIDSTEVILSRCSKNGRFNCKIFPVPPETRRVVEIVDNMTGVPLINQSTSNVLAEDYMNFNPGDTYNITLTRVTDGTVEYNASGTLQGLDIETIQIDWIPQMHGAYILRSDANTTTETRIVQVINQKVISPVPESSTVALTSTNLLGLLGLT